jgi:uncharacterized membrane protein AbrB (regulator of aidB expression)
MLFTILWVLALVLFIDGPEGNRVRFPTESFLFLFLVVGQVASTALDFQLKGHLGAG